MKSKDESDLHDFDRPDAYAALARYTFDTPPNNVMAREYQLALPAVKKLEAKLATTRKRLERAGRT